MRRKEREVKDLAKVLKIVDSCDRCRLGFADGEDVYMVPMNFGYSMQGKTLCLYFHCAREGRKLELVQKNGKAGFEMDLCLQLKEGEKACDYSACYQSVMGAGRITEVTEPDEKLLSLRRIMAHYTSRADLEFSPSVVEHTCVLKLEADWYTAKSSL